MNNIKLNGVKNIRDLGGIPVKEGRIKHHKLIRSSSLDELTDNDVNILVNEYKLATIIDLRTDREMQDDPDIEILNVKYLHMPIFSKRVHGITHENGRDESAGRGIDLIKLYKGILSGECLDNVTEIIKTIIKFDRSNFSVIFHCTEGKDRTGIITALILLILGADKQTIIEDYLVTNKVNRKKAYDFYWRIRFLKHDKNKAENVKNIYLAKPEYIEAVFDVIENDWKGTENFIKNGLKLTEDEIEEFKDKMIY